MVEDDSNPEWAESACSFLVRRHRDYAPNRPAEEPPAKARERSEQERGGGWGASEASELEGGSEGIGRPPADGRNSPAVSFAVGADCCGALSCHERSGLLKVERGGKTRVLCADCAAGWSP